MQCRILQDSVKMRAGNSENKAKEAHGFRMIQRFQNFRSESKLMIFGWIKDTLSPPVSYILIPTSQTPPPLKFIQYSITNARLKQTVFLSFIHLESFLFYFQTCAIAM